MEFNNIDKIIAVSRFDDTVSSLNFADACLEGGINLVEVIVIRKGAYQQISELSENHRITVGAGTVLDLQSAKQAHGAGAEFIVSPHTDGEIIEYARSNNIISVAGAYTSSEIVKAVQLGADYVKIFPASSAGPKYIRAIKEALPFVNIMVTGGINLDNLNEYIASGASLVGISTALTGNNNTFDKNAVASNAKKFKEALDVDRSK